MALARRRHSPDEAKLSDDTDETWLSQAERDAVTIAFLEGGGDALTELVGYGTSLHSSTLPADLREPFVLSQIAGENRYAAIGRWADERRIPHHVALRRFERPQQPGDIVATRTMLRL
jgi:hypothetical protein